MSIFPAHPQATDEFYQDYIHIFERERTVYLSEHRSIILLSVMKDMPNCEAYAL